jgi:3D (Asp-Asp-Asp) domain-containing protein
VTSPLVFLLSAYCACTICTKKETPDYITKSGKRAEAGVTVACSKDRLGQMVHIDSIGVRFCEDVGSAITKGRIDIYFESHKDAKNFGLKKRKVEFIENR